MSYLRKHIIKKKLQQPMFENFEKSIKMNSNYIWNANKNSIGITQVLYNIFIIVAQFNRITTMSLSTS